MAASAPPAPPPGYYDSVPPKPSGYHPGPGNMAAPPPSHFGAYQSSPAQNTTIVVNQPRVSRVGWLVRATDYYQVEVKRAGLALA